MRISITIQTGIALAGDPRFLLFRTIYFLYFPSDYCNNKYTMSAETDAGEGDDGGSGAEQRSYGGL